MVVHLTTTEGCSYSRKGIQSPGDEVVLDATISFKDALFRCNELLSYRTHFSVIIMHIGDDRIEICSSGSYTDGSGFMPDPSQEFENGRLEVFEPTDGAATGATMGPFSRLRDMLMAYANAYPELRSTDVEQLLGQTVTSC